MRAARVAAAALTALGLAAGLCACSPGEHTSVTPASVAASSVAPSSSGPAASVAVLSTPPAPTPTPSTPAPAAASAALAQVSQALQQLDAATRQAGADLSAGDSARAQNDDG